MFLSPSEVRSSMKKQERLHRRAHETLGTHSVGKERVTSLFVLYVIEERRSLHLLSAKEVVSPIKLGTQRIHWIVRRATNSSPIYYTLANIILCSCLSER